MVSDSHFRPEDRGSMFLQKISITIRLHGAKGRVKYMETLKTTDIKVSFSVNYFTRDLGQL
jgi:hypothetical protein